MSWSHETGFWSRWNLAEAVFFDGRLCVACDKYVSKLHRDDTEGMCVSCYRAVHPPLPEVELLPMGDPPYYVKVKPFEACDYCGVRDKTVFNGYYHDYLPAGGFWCSECVADMETGMWNQGPSHERWAAYEERKEAT
jgi:hypothetical protein